MGSDRFIITFGSWIDERMADDSFEDVAKTRLCTNPKHAEKSFIESFPEIVQGFWQGPHDG
jgi:hypothetical protein